MNETMSTQPGQDDRYLHIQTPDGLDYRLEIANMGARSHAFLIDWHIRLLIATAWLFGMGTALFSLSELESIFDLDDMAWPFIMLWLSTLFIYLFYHIVLEIVMGGRTPGKRMAGVKLVTLQGKTPGAGAIILRNVFRLIDALPGFYAIGLICVGLTRHHVRIGDLASGLVLVYDDAVKQKELQQMTRLAMHSELSNDDQALLIDLLKRWKQLSRDTRIQYARHFLQRIGHDAHIPATEKKHDKTYKQVLEQLLAGESGQ